MNNFYSFFSIARQGMKTKVALMAYSMMLFTSVGFAQAPDVHQAKGNVLKPNELAPPAQKTTAETLQQNGDQSHSLQVTSTSMAVRDGAQTFSELLEYDGLLDPGNCFKGTGSINIETTYDSNEGAYTFADDFEVLPNEKFTLQQLDIIILLEYGRGLSQTVVTFYENSSGGGPGIEIPITPGGGGHTLEDLGVYNATYHQYKLTITLGTPIEFAGGVNGSRYWAGVKLLDDSGSTTIQFTGTDIGTSETFYVFTGTSWEKNTVAYSGVSMEDLVMQVRGVCNPGYVYSNNSWSPSTPDGFATDSDNLTIIDGTPLLAADNNVHNVLIKSGATLEIKGVLNLYGDLKIDGDLIFLSDFESDGELGHVASTSAITGEATVHRYFMDERSFRMVSSSLTTTTTIQHNWQEDVHNTGTNFPGDNQNPNPGFGTHITGSTIGANGFDATLTGNPSMFTVNTEGQAFVGIPNTDQIHLNAGFPYLLMVRGNRGVNLTNNSSHSSTVLRTKGKLFKGFMTQDFATQEDGNFGMFGNPYQCTVDVFKVFGNSTNINKFHYYAYDPTEGTYGGYVTIELPDGGSPTETEANQFLQPGQGGQFEVLGPGPSSLVFEESDKVPGQHSASNATGNALSANDMLNIKLYTTENFNNGGPTHDALAIIFGEGNNNEITPRDARKPMNFYENLGVDHNGTYLSIEYREMAQPEEVYNLYSSGYSYADYTLKLTTTGLNDISLYLDDEFTGTSTLLEDGETIYPFTVNSSYPESTATDRFSIRSAERLGVNNPNLLTGISLYPNPLNAGPFYINAPKLNGEKVDLNITDITGRRIYNNVLNCEDNVITVPVDGSWSTGVYLVTVKFAGEESTFRLIKK